MKRTLYPILISAIFSLFLISGCELAGLQLQKDYEFDASLTDPKINMNALEFMKSRPDLFSSMIEAVNYAGLSEEYTKPDRTFLILTNRALSDETYAPSGTNILGSYFACNKKPNPAYNPADPSKGPQYLTPDTWDVYPVETVKSFLLYHIVKEVVSYEQAKTFVTYYESQAYQNIGDTTMVSIHVFNDRYARMIINGFTGTRKVNLYPRTSGIYCSNGVIHVLDDYITPPTKLVLGVK